MTPYIRDNEDFTRKLKAAITLVGGTEDLLTRHDFESVVKALTPNGINFSFTITKEKVE